MQDAVTWGIIWALIYITVFQVVIGVVLSVLGMLTPKAWTIIGLTFAGLIVFVFAYSNFEPVGFLVGLVGLLGAGIFGWFENKWIRQWKESRRLGS